MNFAIRPTPKKVFSKIHNIKFSEKYQTASGNIYGLIAPDASEKARAHTLHENNNSDDSAIRLAEKRVTERENDLDRLPNDPLSGGSLNEAMRELAGLASTVASRLSQEEMEQLNNQRNTSEIGAELSENLQSHTRRGLEEGVADPRVSFDGNTDNERSALIKTFFIVASKVFGVTPAGRALGFAQMALEYVNDEFLKSEPSTKVSGEVHVGTDWTINGKKVHHDIREDIQYPEDYVSPEERERIKQLLHQLENGIGRGGEVDPGDLISRHIPDKGVIGGESNPKPWENDGTINWGELGKSSLKKDESTTAHNGDEYITDPPEDSSGGGDVEPSSPPTGNGLRNISYNMNSTNTEMKGNTGLSKDFYHRAWAVTDSGEFDDITKYGRQVGNNSYRGWDMVAAEVIGGVNTAIWMHDNGKLSCWKLDSDWDYQGSKIHLGGSDGFLRLEDQFETDFDNNGIVGFVDSPNKEMAGNTGLSKDFHHRAWAVTDSGEFDDITRYGRQVGDNSYRGWDMVAAENINGVHKTVWIHETGKMSCWQLNSDWDYQAHQIHLEGSNGFRRLEDQFKTDFDKDGFIGFAPDSLM